MFWTFWLIGWFLLFFWMGLAGLRLVWPILEPLLSIFFQPEAVESIAKSPPFTWWPNLEDARWFWLNALGQGVVQVLLGSLLVFFGWSLTGAFIFFAIPRMLSNWFKTGSIFGE